MTKEFIAYKDSKNTIEWYFDSKGMSQVFEYYEDLDVTK